MHSKCVGAKEIIAGGLGRAAEDLFDAIRGLPAQGGLRMFRLPRWVALPQAGEQKPSNGGRGNH